MIVHLLAALTALTQPTRVDTVRATITAVIAEESPRTPFFFASVSGLAIDKAGRVFVSDAGEARIAVFATDGKALTTIGRKGKGPGEFQSPTGPVIGNDDALYVRNMSEVARFVPDASGIAKQFDRAFAGPSMAPWMSKLATVIDRTGRLHFPLEWGSSADGLTHHAYDRFSLDGRKLDSIYVPMQPTARSNWASVPVSARGGRMVKGINVVPFHPVPVFAVSAVGTILSSPSDKYTLQETDASARVVRELTRSVAPPSIPAVERADSARALGRRLDSLRVPLSQVNGVSEEVKARRLPQVYPVFRSLTVGADGTIWARRWSAATQRGTSWFDVLAEDGRYLRTVVVPTDCTTLPAPVVRGTTFTCVQLDPQTDAETVIIATIPGRR
ncbi:MAG: 6-bladed beta-propeller [Gemmatimonas sp.]